jgi:CRISPR system Cascade subunit CasE
MGNAMTVWTARLRLNPQHPAVAGTLADRHQMHGFVMSMYPVLPGLNGHARETFEVLYRVEGRDLLLQSAVKPDLLKLPSGCCEIVGFGGQDHDGIRHNDEYRFRLQANPSRRISATRKVVHLKTQREWMEWIERRATDAGFDLLEVQATAIGIPPVYGHQRQTGRRITHHTVEYRGRLRVTDVDVFRRTLRQGIGKGKAYGLGLLVLERADGANEYAA